jgi:hypothetical protein
MEPSQPFGISFTTFTINQQGAIWLWKTKLHLEYEFKYFPSLENMCNQKDTLELCFNAPLLTSLTLRPTIRIFFGGQWVILEMLDATRDGKKE